MSEADATNLDELAEEEPGKKSRLPLIMGLVLALVLGGGGFFVTYSGLFSLAPFLGGEQAEEPEAPLPAAYTDPNFAFVAVGEMVIPLGPKAEADVLIIESSIEVAPDDVTMVTTLMPRIRDVFNTYLRAIEESDLELPGASMQLRAQLLRRIRVVINPVEPRDLLFTSFVLR